MKIKVLILILLTITSSAQNRISFEDNCLNRNSVILVEAITALKGEKFIKNLVAKHADFLIFCYMDSLGHVREVIRILPSGKQISEETTKEIGSYLINAEIAFYVCYTKPPELNRNQAIARISEELARQDKLHHLINIAFPGEYMRSFEQQKSDAESYPALSRYEFLKAEMKKIRLIPVMMRK